MSEAKDNIRFFSSIIGAICLVVITPMFAWGMNEFVEFTREIDARVSVLEYEAGLGPRYTQNMAKGDFRPVVEKLNDHELRIRELEQNSYADHGNNH